jgi:hypothetical protein
MTAIPLEAASTLRAMPEAVSSSDADPLQPEAGCVTATRDWSRTCTLALSRSRTHDAVLNVLKAYKLSGNFHNNLEAVLNDMGVSEMVAYQVEPHPTLAFPDCRRVAFTRSEDVRREKFDEIITSIKTRIGFDVPWWGKLLRRGGPKVADAAPMCRTHY